MAYDVAFHRSLLGRSILLGVVPAVALVLAVVGLNAYRAWRNVTVQLEEDLTQSTELVAREIDIRNQRHTELARAVAAAQEAGQFGRRAETLRMLETLVRAGRTGPPPAPRQPRARDRHPQPAPHRARARPARSTA